MWVPARKVPRRGSCLRALEFLVLKGAMPTMSAVQAPPPTMVPSRMPSANPAAMQPGSVPGAATAEELQQLVSYSALSRPTHRVNPWLWR